MKVIVRANESGVWFGELAAHAENYEWVKLVDALHLWQWQAKSGVSCAALAATGIDLKKSKVSPAVTVVVRNPCEVIEVTDAAAKTYVG